MIFHSYVSLPEGNIRIPFPGGGFSFLLLHALLQAWKWDDEKWWSHLGEHVFEGAQPPTRWCHNDVPLPFQMNPSYRTVPVRNHLNLKVIQGYGLELVQKWIVYIWFTFVYYICTHFAVPGSQILIGTQYCIIPDFLFRSIAFYISYSNVIYIYIWAVGPFSLVWIQCSKTTSGFFWCWWNPFLPYLAFPFFAAGLNSLIAK